MAFVHCRECGHEIKAETKQTRCENCGTFFPFTCAVCDKFLRPPFAVMEDERYVTEDHQPLCQDHYQRQCPECKKWFQADENPGYFLCLDCTQSRAQRKAAASASSPKSQKPAKGSKGKGRQGGKTKTKETVVGASAPAKSADTMVFVVIGGALVLGILFMLLRGG